jgi:DNA-binding NtrC family response regulator
VTFSESLTAHAAQYLRNCLKETNDNVRAAARIAGMHRATFYILCQKCGVAIVRENPPPRGHKSLSVWLGTKSQVQSP